MTTAIFKITDGTNSVDLLELREGVSAEGWLQAIAQYRGGGTFQQSSLADGRRLVDKRFDTIIETIPVSSISSESSQDVTISILHKLFALMELASDYWVHDWVQTPVWIESRAECETNTRYAIVVVASIPNLDQIYAPGAFAGPNATLTDMQLVIEHGHWQDTRPGTATAAPISAVESWDGVNYGNVDSSEVREPATSGVYLTNMRGVMNYTHIFTWSAANGWSANLLGGPFPYDLIDVAGAAPQVNDLLYFGIQNVAPFQQPRSLVLDIGTAQTGISLVWEYWTGAAWAAHASIQDNTAAAQPLDTAGVNSIHWAMPAGPPSSVVVNGINAYWIRARVTAVPGPVVAPTQQSRDPYMIDWPYTEIQTDEITGDLDALVRIKLAVESHNDGGAGAIDDLFYNRVIMGLRSQSRGSNFVAYLNADSQAAANPTGVTFAASGGAFAVASLIEVSPVNEVGNISSAIAVAATDAFTWTLGKSIAPEFYGTFRAYGVFWFSTYGSPNVVTFLKVKLGAGGETLTSPTTFTVPAATTTYLLVDYGKVVIPQPGITTTSDPMTVELTTNIELLGATTGALVHLVLMPVDEWAIDTQDTVNDTDSTVEEGRYLDIDSVINPSIPLRSLAREVSDDEVTGIYLAVKNGPATLHKDSLQRIWCLTAAPLSAGSSTWVSDIRTSASIQIEKVQRYLGPRGTM